MSSADFDPHAPIPGTTPSMTPEQEQAWQRRMSEDIACAMKGINHVDATPTYDAFQEMREKLRPWLAVEEADANGLDWQSAADAKFNHEDGCSGCPEDRCDAGGRS